MQPQPDEVVGYLLSNDRRPGKDIFNQRQYRALEQIHAHNKHFSEAVYQVAAPFLVVNYTANSMVRTDLFTATNRSAGAVAAFLKLIEQLNHTLATFVDVNKDEVVEQDIDAESVRVFNGSVSSDNSCENTKSTDGADKRLVPHPRAVQNIAYAISIDLNIAQIFVCWLEEDKPFSLGWAPYRLQEVSSFALRDPRQLVMFHQELLNILEWGMGERLKAFKKALDVIADEYGFENSKETNTVAAKPDKANSETVDSSAAKTEDTMVELKTDNALDAGTSQSEETMMEFDETEGSVEPPTKRRRIDESEDEAKGGVKLEEVDGGEEIIASGGGSVN